MSNTFVIVLAIQTLILITAFTSSISMIIDIIIYLIDREDRLNAATWVIPSILWGVVYLLSKILDKI